MTGAGEPMWDRPDWGARCPACGQVKPPALRVCYCAHPVTEHDIPGKGGRSRCLRTSCGCTQWRPDEQHEEE